MSDPESPQWTPLPPPANDTNGDEHYYWQPTPPTRDYEPVQPQSGVRSLLRKIWAPIAAAGAFVLKFGAILLKLKVFTVGATMLVSVGAYALLGGWWFGVGLVLLIFVHEMGHVLEL